MRKIKKIITNNLILVKIAFRASPIRVLLEFVVNIFTSIFNVFYVSFFFRYIFNYIEISDFDKLKNFLFLSCLVFLTEVIIRNVFNGIIRAKYDQVLVEAINTKIFEKCRSIDIEMFDNKEYYQKISKATNEADLYIIQSVSNVSRLISSSIGMLALTTIIAGTNIVFILFIILPVTLKFFMGKASTKKKHDLKVENHEGDRFKTYILNTLYSPEYAKEMRLYNIFYVLKNHFIETSKKKVDNIRYKGKTISILDFFSNMLGSPIAFLCSTMYAVYLYNKYGIITIGDIAVIGISITSTINLCFQIIDVVIAIFSVNLYVDLYNEFMDIVPQICVCNEYGKSIEDIENIVFEKVSFKYKNLDKDILHNINLILGKNEKVVIIGNNGVGKSTFLNLLLRLYDCNEGKILINGINIKDINLVEYRKLFNVSFQENKIFAFSIRDNLLLNVLDEVSDFEIWEALDKVGLSEKVNRLDMKLDTIMTKEFFENGVIFSGGEMKRLALARIFLSKAPIVVLDEPAEAIDPISEKEIMDNIFEFCKEKTLVYVSHSISDAKFADKIVVFDEGKIINIGKHEELITFENYYTQRYRQSLS